MYGKGVAAVDYDNDGRDDIYITAWMVTTSSITRAAASFMMSPKASGIANANFGTSAAWLDYDRDGKADLFMANYVQWTPKGDLWISLDGASQGWKH